MCAQLTKMSGHSFSLKDKFLLIRLVLGADWHFKHSLDHEAVQPRISVLLTSADAYSRTTDTNSQSADAISQSADAISRTADAISQSADAISRTADAICRTADADSQHSAAAALDYIGMLLHELGDALKLSRTSVLDATRLNSGHGKAAYPYPVLATGSSLFPSLITSVRHITFGRHIYICSSHLHLCVTFTYVRHLQSSSSLRGCQQF